MCASSEAAQLSLSWKSPVPSLRLANEAGEGSDSAYEASKSGQSESWARSQDSCSVISSVTSLSRRGPLLISGSRDGGTVLGLCATQTSSFPPGNGKAQLPPTLACRRGRVQSIEGLSRRTSPGRYSPGCSLAEVVGSQEQFKQYESKTLDDLVNAVQAAFLHAFPPPLPPPPPHTHSAYLWNMCLTQRISVEYVSVLGKA